jgi:cytoskeletal protein RodZ
MVVAALVLAVLLLPAVAGAQTPMPGETPEPIREWVWWLAFPVILGTLGILLLVAVSYLRLSSRFYAKEEPPPVRRQPIYAGVNAPAYPAPVTQEAPAPVAAQAQAEAPAAAPAAQQAPAATQVQERPAAEAPAQQAPAAEATAPEAPAAEAPEPAKEEAPAPQAEAGPEQKPEPKKEAAPDDDVYQRVLQEQLDKGVSPKVAEGRAKAAALKAARQAGG